MVNTNLDTWRFTPVRLDGICTGIFLSVFLSREDIALSLSKKTGELIVATIMLFVVSLFCKAVMSDIFWYSFGNSILVLSFGFLLTTALAQRLLNHGHGILSSVMLRYLGLRCYSIYLFHILFMLSISALISNFFVGLLTQTILTLGFAHMSWKYIEYPLINLARRFSY